jgi:hypothetical protein
MKWPFHAFLIRSARGYHMHQREGRVDALARQSLDIGSASSANPYLTIEVVTSELRYRYLSTLGSYEDAD